jgi:hypothetical protein
MWFVGSRRVRVLVVMLARRGVRGVQGRITDDVCAF